VVVIFKARKDDPQSGDPLDLCANGSGAASKQPLNFVLISRNMPYNLGKLVNGLITKEQGSSLQLNDARVIQSIIIIRATSS
jgi:hypothetical protein